jgi:hypothetical protein
VVGVSGHDPDVLAGAVSPLLGLLADEVGDVDPAVSRMRDIAAIKTAAAKRMGAHLDVPTEVVLGVDVLAPCAPQPPFEDRDRYGRYKLKHPTKGRIGVVKARASKLPKIMDDTYNLSVWQQGNVALGLARRPDLLAIAASCKPGDQRLKALVKTAAEAGGGSEKANLGTAIHGFTEMVDHGEPLSSVPEQHRDDVAAYIDARIGARLTVVPMAIERIVMTSRWGGVAGMFDRIYRTHDGTFVVGDLKTGKIGYDDKTMAAQAAVYAEGANEVGVYDVAAKRWDPLPFTVRTDIGLIVHLLADSGECVIKVADLSVGRAHMDVCAMVREQRAVRYDLTDYDSPAYVEEEWVDLLARAATRDEVTAIGRLAAAARVLTPELRTVAIGRRNELPE